MREAGTECERVSISEHVRLFVRVVLMSHAPLAEMGEVNGDDAGTGTGHGGGEAYLVAYILDNSVMNESCSR